MNLDIIKKIFLKTSQEQRKVIKEMLEMGGIPSGAKPEYAVTMDADVIFGFLAQLSDEEQDILMRMVEKAEEKDKEKEEKLPLVTVAVPNYNYGHYLGFCLESLLRQTCTRFEVRFSDNASTDRSVEIAKSYQKKFLDRGIYFNINVNKKNLGSDANSKIATSGARGKYIYTLGSDDAVYPEFIERCIDVFERYPKVGTVLVNRDEIDENGNVRHMPPFYNTSCVIDGDAQAGVYMLAGIGIPGQRVVRRSILGRIVPYMRRWNVAGDWYDNFLYACVGDVAYIKDSLMYYRVHTGNETNESERRLVGITEHYQLIHAFLDVADAFQLKKPRTRYEDAVRHLGEMCPRYALRMIRDHQIEAARKYLQLALVFNEDMAENQDYKDLKEILRLKDDAKILEEAEAFRARRNLNRTKSYDPPEGWQPLVFDGQEEK